MLRARREGITGFRKSAGFTLFEMVVVICSIVILYMVAERRMNELPAAAERANFYALLEQIKTGINFEMINHVVSGNYTGISELEGGNPMNLLLEKPRNYRGEMAVVTDRDAIRRSWYFETSTGELVYVVGGPSIEDVFVTIAGIPVNLGQIRFRMVNVFDNRAAGNAAGSAGYQPDRSRWQGLQLVPVWEFEWERREETPVDI